MRLLIDIAVPATTFILLVAVGLELTADDFARVRRQRALVLIGLLAPLVLLPLIAIGLARVFQTTPDVTAGVLLIAACPIGSVSNSYCYLARASTALSVTLTGLSCLCASLTIPFVGKAFELALSRPFELQAPIPLLAAQVLLVLGLPVVLGMLARRYSPTLTMRCGHALQRLAVGGILAILVLVIVDDAPAFVGGLESTIPLAVTFVVVSIVVGWTSAVFLTPDRRDRFVIAAGFGARNVAVATAIAVTLLGHLEFARFAATYALIELPLMLLFIALFRMSEVKVTA